MGGRRTFGILASPKPSPKREGERKRKITFFKLKDLNVKHPLAVRENSHKDDLKVLPEVAPAGRAKHFGSIKRIDKVNVQRGFKKKSRK